MERYVIELTDDLSYIYAVEECLSIILEISRAGPGNDTETAGSGHEAD